MVMKVKDLLEALSQYEPDKDICVLWWDKETYDYTPESEEQLSSEAWARICKEFDEWEEAGLDESQWIADAVIEYSETKELQ
jgi:hypothetical protein